jgi:hypothetical protein
VNQLALAAVAWLAVVCWRHHALTKGCYTHVKRHIMAEEHAADQQRTKDKQVLQSPITVAPASPYAHVTLWPRLLFIVLPARRMVHGATIRWAPLVAYPNPDWLDELVSHVAHWLGTHPDDLERHATRIRRRRTRIVRARGGASHTAFGLDDEPGPTPARPLGPPRSFDRSHP